MATVKAFALMGIASIAIGTALPVLADTVASKTVVTNTDDNGD